MSNPLSLRPRRDFERVFASGRRRRTSSGTFFTLIREDQGPARLGVAVPATVGGSVVRNRVKRRLRAAVRANAPGPGVDLVVRAHRGAVAVDFQNLEEDVRMALRG